MTVGGGGGGGGNRYGGGGGAGGVAIRTSVTTVDSPKAIVVGPGGSGGPDGSRGSDGSSSFFGPGTPSSLKGSGGGQKGVHLSSYWDRRRVPPMRG